MGLAVLPPDFEDEVVQPTDVRRYDDHPEDSDTSMDEADGRPSKRVRLTELTSGQIVLPGEAITDDTQWMRYGGTQMSM